MTTIHRISTLPHFRPTLEGHFGLMGEALTFQTNDAALLEIAGESFGRFPLPRGDMPPLIVQLFVDGKLPGPPGAADPRMIYHAQGNLFTLQAGEAGSAVVDLQKNIACGFISPALAQRRPFVRYNFVEALALCQLSLGRGYLPIHASCVVKDGASLLLQARSGVGKTTLAYACVRRGYRLLAEDVVHVQTKAEGQYFWGSPWKLHLLPDARRFFPELAGLDARLQTNGEWKIEVDLDRFFPGAALPWAAPGPVVLLERGDKGAPSLECLSPEIALSDFEVLWPWPTGWTDDLEQATQRLLARGVYRLHMNGSPEEAVDCLGQLTAEFAGGRP